MNPVERVLSVVQGRRPDHPPVSFWCHFPAGQIYGAGALEAHLNHLRTFDLDFLKVMNDNGYPHTKPIASVADLESLRELRGDEPEFTRQLDLLQALKAELRGRVWMTTTIFNAWATLRNLIGRPAGHRPPDMDAASDHGSARIRAMYAENPAALQGALMRIGLNLAKFAGRCVEVGADGIFLSVRDDWVEPTGRAGVYERIMEPTDRLILRAAWAGQFNMLHVCGKAMDFRAFASYPAHVINWADRSAGPSITQTKGWVTPAICAGVDNLNTLATGSVQDIEAQVADALAQAGTQPIMIAPGCTYDPGRVPPANLKALVRAARNAVTA